VRVSTDEQAEKGYSLSHQRARCRERAIELGASKVQEYADEGVSGSLLDRPGLAALRRAVRAKAIDLVVVYDPDRLARRLAYQLLITDEIEASGAKLEFVNFEWRNTPEGQLFYALRGAVAQYEKEKIRERTMAGRRQKAKEGKMPNAYCPYGYRYDAKTHGLVIDETEAAVVRRIFNLLVHEGFGINGIAAYLTRARVPTRRGLPAWHRVVVRQILRNPVYYGTFYANRMDCEGVGLNRHLPAGQKRPVRIRPREDWIPISVPPIIDGELWRRAQEAMQEASRRMHTHPRSDYLLSGLLTCGVCGQPMCGCRRNNWGETVRTYTCRRSWAGAKTPGCNRYVPAEPLEAAVWARVTEWVAHPARLAQAVTEDAGATQDATADELTRIEDALRAAERGRRDILRVLEQQLADPEDCLETLKRIKERTDSLLARKGELTRNLLPQPRVDADQVRAWATEWLASGAMEDMPFERRRTLVRQVIAGITVHEDTLVIRARLPGPSATSGNKS
jgi:site-specific DNA recombinase